MMRNYRISLKIEDSMIEVTVNIKLEEKEKISFILKDSMEILECSGKYSSKIEDVNFIGKCNRYYFLEKINNLKVKYKGKPYGACTECSKEKIMLPSYAGWYPILDQVIFNDIYVEIQGLENFIVIDGIKKENVWYFYNKVPYDCNIRAFNKNKIFIKESKYLKIYSSNKKEVNSMNKISNEYEKIIEYYIKILGEKENNMLKIISNGELEGGGYFRPGFIVMPYLDITDDFIYSFIGHELAHEWHHGYSTDTYDDWLNEVGAEWTSLSYIIYKNKMELYKKQIEKAKKAFDIYPIMKPKDESRPKTVHFGGVLLLDKIYSRYGLNIINRILKTMYETEPKTTKQFLINIKKDFDGEVFDILEEPFR